MKIVYLISIQEDAYPPGRADVERVSATVSQIETEAHRWMGQHYPDVEFETMRLAGSDAPPQVRASNTEERARGEKILAELKEHINRQW